MIRCEFDFVSGQSLSLRLDYNPDGSNGYVRLGWVQPGGGESGQLTADNGGGRFAEAIAAARVSDLVIFCGGLNHHHDTEGTDRNSLHLPDGQDELIEALLVANPKTVVCLTAGSPVAMDWLDKAPVVLWTWYAGMESGNALADILFGGVNPSGKLPMTMPKSLTNVPAHAVGEYQAERCEYKEGVFVGYRYFDQYGIEPLFPFGHGLSYTSFGYDHLTVNLLDDPEKFAMIACEIRNCGEREGAEVVQLYLGDVGARVPRPPRELKGFQKVWLRPGEKKRVEFTVKREDLAFFDPEAGSWVVEPGEFRLEVGSSSREIWLRGSFTI